MTKPRTNWRTIVSITIPTLLLIVCGVFFVFREKGIVSAPTASAAPTPAIAAPTATQTQTQEDEMTGNLMAWADDRAAAEKMAALYQITLLQFENNIAVFWTEQNPETLIQVGKENGWPELSKIHPITVNEQ